MPSVLVRVRETIPLKPTRVSEKDDPGYVRSAVERVRGTMSIVTRT